MTDQGSGGWQSPSGGPPGQVPHPYGGADPNQNFGLAYPGAAYHPAYPAMYDVVVPRPPRPAALAVALLLVYFGVVVSLLQDIGSSIYQWQNRSEMIPAPTGPGEPDLTGMTETFATFGVVLTFLLWAGAATGIIICAVLVNRLKNAARITLAVVMGVLAVYQLCSVGSSLLATSLLDSLPSDPSTDSQLATVDVPWWLMIGPALLCVIAATVAILLIVPSVNRFFSPGAGRQFAVDA